MKPLENLIGKGNNLIFQKTDDQASKQDWVNRYCAKSSTNEKLKK